MNDPFAVLGIPSSATPAEIRAAYKRLAFRHHPDRNPGDPRAPERFKRLVNAYRAALSVPGGATATRPPSGPRPDRYACGACGDTFPFLAQCPRCEVALHDRRAHRADPPEDPRVEAWIRALEQRAPMDETTLESLPCPGAVAATFLAAAALVVTLGGPTGPALLFAGFAAYVVASEGHRMLEPVWARNDR